MTREYTLIIPRVPISQNSDEWRERWARRRYKAEWQRDAFNLCKVHKIPPLHQVRLYAVVYWGDRRRRDLDNHHPTIFKAVQDGLEAAGVILADDTRYIPELPGLRFGYDKERPRTEITVTELEQ